MFRMHAYTYIDVGMISFIIYENFIIRMAIAISLCLLLVKHHEKSILCR